MSIAAISQGKSAERCADFIVHLKQVVHVCSLHAEDYKVKANNGLGDTLKIGEASSESVDDSIYAAIE